MKLLNKVAVITGGNSGLGLAIAEEFIAQGAQVVIFGRNQKKLNEALNKLGKNVLAVAGDVTKITDLKHLFTTVKEKFSKLDILVANAGMGKEIKIEQVTEKDFDEIFNVNVKGLFFTVQQALPYFNDNGSIILMASVAGHLGRPKISLYSGTKAATSAFARSLAAELLERNIRVNSLSPGYIFTPFFQETGISEADLKNYAAKVLPMKRVGQPEEVAKAALFLASDDSSYITGNDLLIDGGRLNVRIA